MLNKDGKRELAYLVRVDDIRPIEGKDRVECAVVGGWTIMVRKEQFKPGDIGIYFEIDSKVPPTEEFVFLAPKKYKIKTQKYGNFYSQGLLMHPNDFGWEVKESQFDNIYYVVDSDCKEHYVDDESRFVTKVLGVVYSVAEDNKRKSNVDPYQRMIQRLGKKAKRQPYKWLLKRNWGKKFLFKIYGKKSDYRGWPDWVSKTDEERVENMKWILEDKTPFIATEKIDGTSTTFTMKRNKNIFGKESFEFIVCSRNVPFVKPDAKCFYDTNVYIEMAEKYNIEAHMKDMLGNHPEWEWVTIQAETFGAGIQKNNYGLDHKEIRIFNFITSDRGRWGTMDMQKFLEVGYNLPIVPIIKINYTLPNTVEELREFVHEDLSMIDGELKEGIVFRKHDGSLSFKCVDPDYLLKYHI